MIELGLGTCPFLVALPVRLVALPNLLVMLLLSARGLSHLVEFLLHLAVVDGGGRDPGTHAEEQLVLVRVASHVDYCRCCFVCVTGKLYDEYVLRMGLR